MSKFVVLNSLGDGNCLFNSFAINLAHSFLFEQAQDKWLKRIKNPHFKKHYIDLTNALLPKINECLSQQNLKTLKPRKNRSRSKTLFARLDLYFKSFQISPDDPLSFDWMALQKHLGAILRQQVVNKCLDTSRNNVAINYYDQEVVIDDLLTDVFDNALKETVLSYPFTRHARTGGYFQDHPVFINKLKQLFDEHQFDFKPYEDLEAAYDEEKLKKDCRPIQEAFKQWFIDEGEEAFYYHPTHGLAHDENQADQFSLQMLSLLFDFKIALTTFPAHRSNNLDIISDKNRNIWSLEYRFFVPDRCQEIAPPNEDDLLLRFRNVPGHWQACLPASQQNLELAKRYLQQKNNYYEFLSEEILDLRTNLLPYLIFALSLTILPIAWVYGSLLMSVVGLSLSAISYFNLPPQAPQKNRKSTHNEEIEPSSDEYDEVEVEEEDKVSLQTAKSPTFTPGYNQKLASPENSPEQAFTPKEKKQATLKL